MDPKEHDPLRSQQQQQQQHRDSYPSCYSKDYRTFCKPKTKNNVANGKVDFDDISLLYINASVKPDRSNTSAKESHTPVVNDRYASVALVRTEISRTDFDRGSTPRDPEESTEFDLYLRSKTLYGLKAVRGFCAWKAMRDTLKTDDERTSVANRFGGPGPRNSIAKDGDETNLYALSIAHPKYAIQEIDCSCDGLSTTKGSTGAECSGGVCSTDLTLNVCVNPACCTRGTFFRVNLKDDRWYENLCAAVGEMISAQMSPSTLSPEAQTLIPITGVRLLKGGMDLQECVKEKGARFLATPALIRVRYDNCDAVLRDYLKKGKCDFTPLKIPENRARLGLRSDAIRERFCESVSDAFWSKVHSEIRSNIVTLGDRASTNLHDKPKLTRAKLDALVSECMEIEGALQKTCDTFGCKKETVKTNVGAVLKESYSKFMEIHDPIFTEYANVRSNLRLDKNMFDTQTRLMSKDANARGRFAREADAIHERIVNASQKLGDEPVVIGKIFHDHYALEKSTVRKAMDFVMRRSEAGLETDEGLIHPAGSSKATFKEPSEYEDFSKNRTEKYERTKEEDNDIQNFERSLGLTKDEIHEAKRATTRTMAHVNKLMVDLEKGSTGREESDDSATTPKSFDEPEGFEKKYKNPFKKTRSFDALEKKIQETMGFSSKNEKENVERLAKSIAARCRQDVRDGIESPAISSDWPKSMAAIRDESADPFESGAKSVYYRGKAGFASNPGVATKKGLGKGRSAAVALDVGCNSEPPLHSKGSKKHTKEEKKVEKEEKKKRKKEEKKRKKNQKEVSAEISPHDKNVEDLKEKMKRHARLVEGAFSNASLKKSVSETVDLKVNLDTEVPGKSSKKCPPKHQKSPSEDDDVAKEEEEKEEKEKEAEEQIDVELKVNLDTDFPSKVSRSRKCPKAKPIVLEGSGGDEEMEGEEGTLQSPQEIPRREEDETKEGEAESTLETAENTPEGESEKKFSTVKQEKYDKMIREIIESEILYPKNDVQTYEEKYHRIGTDLEKSLRFVAGKMDVLVIYHDFGLTPGSPTSYAMFFDRETSQWTSWAGLNPLLETIPDTDFFQVNQNFLGEITFEPDPENPNLATLRGSRPPESMEFPMECRLLTNSNGEWMVGVCHPRERTETFLDMFGNLTPYGRT